MWFKANNSGYLVELKEGDTKLVSIGEKYEGLSINRILIDGGATYPANYYDNPIIFVLRSKHKSIKIKGILRITRDLTLTRDNNQVHMVLFLDKNTPEDYINMIPFEDNRGFYDNYTLQLIDREKKYIYYLILL